jgi:hypothetical protein
MPCLWQVKAIVEYMILGGDGDAADAPQRHAAGVPLKRGLPALVCMNEGAAANMGAIGPLGIPRCIIIILGTEGV